MFKNPPYVSLKYNSYITNVGLIIEQNIHVTRFHIVLFFFSLINAVYLCIHITELSNSSWVMVDLKYVLVTLSFEQIFSLKVTVTTCCMVYSRKYQWIGITNGSYNITMRIYVHCTVQQQYGQRLQSFLCSIA